MSSSKTRRIRARTTRVRANTERFEQELHEFEQELHEFEQTKKDSSKDGVELKVLVYLNESMLDVH